MKAISQVYKRTRTGISRTVAAGALNGESAVTCRPLKGVPLAHQWWMQWLRGDAPVGSTVGAIRTVDIFCGSGGLSLGASLAIQACGMRHLPLLAVDVDATALGVYARNFRPKVALAANAASVIDYHVNGRGEQAEFAYEPEVIHSSFEALIGGVDLVLAGPPCQGHSNLNNYTRRSDPRNMLYVSVAATAIALRAGALVIENVPDVLADSTNVVGVARRVLELSGYQVSTALLSATDLGGPQTRKRHFLVATRGNGGHLQVGDALQALRQPPMTLEEAIGDLVASPLQSFMDEVPIMSPENRARIEFLFNNNLYDLPNEERPNCHKGGHTYPSVYGRLSWNKPSPTITTGFGTPGRGRYIHPAHRRVLTAREAARLQGFPDTFEFTADGKPPLKRELSKWIGDAVPSWLGYAAVLSALSGY